MTTRTYLLQTRVGTGIVSQTDWAREESYLRSDNSDNQEVPQEAGSIPIADANVAVCSYSDVVASRPPAPRRERPVVPLEGSRQEAEGRIRHEQPERWTTVENNSQVVSGLESYQSEEAVETPDKPEYSQWTTVQNRRARSSDVPAPTAKKYLVRVPFRPPPICIPFSSMLYTFLHGMLFSLIVSLMSLKCAWTVA